MILGGVVKNVPVQFVRQEEIKKNLHFYGRLSFSVMLGLECTLQNNNILWDSSVINTCPCEVSYKYSEAF